MGKVARNLPAPPIRNRGAENHEQFESEEQLVARFLAVVDERLRTEFDCLTEFESSLGRPDVVLHAKTQVCDSVRTLAAINPRYAPLLAADVAPHITCIDDLARAVGSGRSSTTRLVRALSAANVLRLDADRKSFSLRSMPAAPVRDVVAIEAKLRDWRRALVQAYRYIQFASQSWVLLDAKQANGALRNLDAFQTAGIGLATLSVSGVLTVCVPARVVPPNSAPPFWRSQSLFCKRLMLASPE